MKTPYWKYFDRVVASCFAPIADRAKANLCRIADGVYEIEAQRFTVRVRRGTGHRKDILVTLLPSCEKSPDITDLRKEIGLGVIAKFRGEELPELPFDNEEEYLRYTGNLARSAEKFMLPYLVGQIDDCSEIYEFISKNAQEAAREVSAYKFPKTVRKEWL